MADFWREIVRRANGCLGAIICVLEDTGDTEVADFDLSTLCHEDVLRLEVAVENFTVMDVLDGKRHLDKPVKDLVLAIAYWDKNNKIVRRIISILTSANFLLVRDLGIKVTSICVVHHNTQTSFIHERFFVRDDVWVPHRFKHMNLFEK